MNVLKRRLVCAVAALAVVTAIWLLASMFSTTDPPEVETRCDKIVRGSEVALHWKNTERHGEWAPTPRPLHVPIVGFADVPRHEGAWIRVTGILHLEPGGPDASPSGYTYTLLRSPVTTREAPVEDRLFPELDTLPGDWRQRLSAIDDRCVVVEGYVQDQVDGVVARIITPVTSVAVWGHARIPLNLVPQWEVPLIAPDVH
jgi:hypothetical protein